MKINVRRVNLGKDASFVVSSLSTIVLLATQSSCLDVDCKPNVSLLVVDSEGAHVVGATVVLDSSCCRSLNPRTTCVYSTDAEGRVSFQVGAESVSSCQVSVTASGFQDNTLSFSTPNCKDLQVEVRLDPA